MLTLKLGDLEDLGLPDLRSTWQLYYGTTPPASMSRELLRLAIGYKMQEKLSGGLSRRTSLQLSSLASASASKRHVDPFRHVYALKPGTKLVREWQGKVHEVLALEVMYRGALSVLLTSHTYRNMIKHGGNLYVGEHERIVREDLFEAVQSALAAQGPEVPLLRLCRDDPGCKGKSRWPPYTCP